MRLAKAGGYYTVVDQESVPASDDSLRRIVRDFVLEVDVAQNLMIVKTGAGNASTVTQALDEASWPESIGSIAGENTIFVAARSSRDAQRMARRFKELLA